MYAAKETRARARVCVCMREPGGHGWVGRSGGLGSIGHSYGNVSNYRTELLARPEDPVSVNQRWPCDVEEAKREAGSGTSLRSAPLRFAPSVRPSVRCATDRGGGRKRNDMIYSGSPSERFWPGAGNRGGGEGVERHAFRLNVPLSSPTLVALTPFGLSQR